MPEPIPSQSPIKTSLDVEASLKSLHDDQSSSWRPPSEALAVLVTIGAVGAFGDMQSDADCARKYGPSTKCECMLRKLVKDDDVPEGWTHQCRQTVAGTRPRTGVGVERHGVSSNCQNLIKFPDLFRKEDVKDGRRAKAAAPRPIGTGKQGKAGPSTKCDCLNFAQFPDGVGVDAYPDWKQPCRAKVAGKRPPRSAGPDAVGESRHGVANNCPNFLAHEELFLGQPVFGNADTGKGGKRGGQARTPRPLSQEIMDGVDAGFPRIQTLFNVLNRYRPILSTIIPAVGESESGRAAREAWIKLLQGAKSCEGSKPIEYKMFDVEKMQGTTWGTALREAAPNSTFTTLAFLIYFNTGATRARRGRPSRARRSSSASSRRR